jgi:TonB dependent receptor
VPTFDVNTFSTPATSNVDVPPHYLRAEVLYKHPNGFYAGPNVEWMPQAFFADNANTLTVDPYALLNFKIGYDPGIGWSGYLEGRNLLDTRYISTSLSTGIATAHRPCSIRAWAARSTAACGIGCKESIMRTKLFATCVALCSLAGNAIAGPDEDAVRHLLHSTFGKPEQKLLVEPVVITAGYAVAGWTQGDMGGRALLQHKHGNWTLILCAGDGIKSAEALRQAGMAPDAASALAQALAKAAQAVPADRLALFAKFEDTVMMNADGSHPPVHQSHTDHGPRR